MTASRWLTERASTGQLAAGAGRKFLEDDVTADHGAVH